MNYLSISKEDMSNGQGSRVVLWVAGCNHHCEKCRSEFSWDLNAGREFTDVEIEDIFNEISKEYISGITFSGGDPLHPKNIETITSLSKEIKKRYPSKTIWCYTGYLYENVQTLDVMGYIDVLVDGRYIDSLSTPSPRWCGSTNQRIIDVKQSLEKGEVILYDTTTVQ